MQVVKMAVSKTVKTGTGANAVSKREEVGKVEIHIPPLAEVSEKILNAKIREYTPEEVKDGTAEEGIPIYETAEADWIYSAIVAAVKAAARNKLVNGTITLREGCSIATSWAELIAEGGRGGGAALAAMRDCKASFAEFITKLGKTENTTNLVIALFGNKTALAQQTSSTKEKFTGYVNDYMESLDDVNLERFNSTLAGILEVAKAEPVTAGSDF